MRIRLKHTCVLCLMMLICVYIKAQQVFIRMGIDEGLSQEAVYDIVEDEEGFVWFATGRGLIRFDGSATKLFDKRHDKRMPGNNVRKIINDGKGRFWLKTSNGICVFDWKDESFMPFVPKLNGKPFSVSGLYQMTEDGKLIVSSGINVYECDTINGECYKINVKPDGLNNKYAPALLRNKHGVIWLGFPNEAIYRADRRRKPTIVGKHPHTPLVLNEYGNDSILIGTLARGVWIMSKRNGESRKLSVPGMTDGNIFAHAFMQVADNEWWIGTDTGIYVLRDGEFVQHFCFSADDPMSISDDHVFAIMKDSKGGIWVGTEKGGVNYCPPTSDRINLVYTGSRFPWLSGRHVTAIAEDKDGKIWVGTDDGGLCVMGDDYNIKLNLSSNRVTDLMFRGDNLWVATYTGGLNVINTLNGQIKYYKKTPEPGSLKNQEDLCLAQDKNGHVWVGSTTDVFWFDDDYQIFTRLEGINSNVVDLVVDNQNRLWMATNRQGLLCYDIDSKCMKSYLNHEDDSTTVANGPLSCLTLDHKGRLWIGSEEDGVCMMDKKIGLFKTMDIDDGLPEGFVCDVIEDADGDIWVVTTGGFALIDAEKWCVEGVWKGIYWMKDGAFSPRTGILTKNNEMFLGTNNGFVHFYPRDLLRSENVFKPLVTDVFFPMGEEQAHGKDVLKNGILTLKYGHSTFGVRFSALDFESGNGGRFEYRLKGNNSDGWMAAEQPMAQWTDLPTGNYELFVRYAADGRTWSEENMCLAIRVLPPWWFTTWAWMIYLIFALLAGMLIWFWMKNRRKKELMQQRLSWESKMKEENAKARIEFFTNVAHEIRTPVSLIRASVEQGIDNNNRGFLERNVERLGQLVDNLLEFRSVESDMHNIVCKEVDVARIIRLTVNSFEPIIRKRKLQILNEIEDNNLLVAMADEEALKTVMTNIISNAVKYADGIIRVSAQRSVEDVKIMVWNDGKPIPEDIREKVFEPFVKGTQKDGSTGIGLALVKLLTKKMNGWVDMKSGDDGTVFSVVLPIYKNNGINAQENVNEIKDNVQKGEETILVVEDNDDMREFLKQRFEKDYKVLTAEDGQAACDILENSDVAIIISDVMMPRMDGFQLCVHVKSNLMTCHIPVILLTAKTTESEHIQGYGMGADAYVNKPFSTAELVAQTASIINNRRLQRESFVKNGFNRAEIGRENNMDESRNDETRVSKDRFMLMSPMDRDFESRLNTYVNEHLSDEDFNIDALAEFMNMSRRNFHRKIKALYDCTPGEYVNVIRMKKAAEMLSSAHYRVSEVCVMVGFHSVAHFSRAFKKFYNISPKDWNNSNL